MIQLEEKIYFYVFAIIPVLLVIFLVVQLWKSNAQKKFANHSLLKQLAPQKSTFKPIFKLVLLFLAIAFLVIALVNPKMGTKLETVKREGVDVVFAIDVSKSMLAKDIAPNRLEKSKRIVSEIINKLNSDRVGIIAYAAQAYPQLPITTDYGAARMFLQSMNTDMLSSQGTAINQAINLAKTYYNDDEQTNRILFIISDGEDHSENALSAIDEAREEGIRIYTIGVGKPAGGTIPIEGPNGQITLKKDSNGEVVITKLNEQILQQIAAEGGGEYINGSDTQKTVNYVAEALNTMDKTEFESKQFADFKDQFQWFLAAAILLLFLDLFVFEKKTKWIQDLNLFNEKEKR